MSDKLRAARRELAVLLCRRECPALCQDGCSPGSRMFELADDILALAARHLGAGGAGVPEGPRWRHVKRGTCYTELHHDVELQSTVPVPEGHMLTVYRDDDGRLWARPSDEFGDGRFAPLPPPPEVKE